MGARLARLAEKLRTRRHHAGGSFGPVPASAGLGRCRSRRPKRLDAAQLAALPCREPARRDARFAYWVLRTPVRGQPHAKRRVFGAAVRAAGSLVRGKPWYTRQEIETLPEAKAALKGRVIAYLADPMDALVLQIQGSGRIRLPLTDGSARTVRLGFAGTNEQPYQSIGKWLLEQGLTRDATWPGIKDWLARNPQRQQELLWRNPRMVFFKEEPLAEADAQLGPRGAQGVALTPGRSIAVDPGSMPYGTPVWISSAGGAGTLQQLVLAQDTGSAIVGAVRADFFAGAGAQAGELAGRLKQPLQMWVLWPR